VKYKKCPLCDFEDIEEPESPLNAVYCPGCGIMAMADDWDTRPEEARLQKKIAELKELIGDLICSTTDISSILRYVECQVDRITYAKAKNIIRSKENE